MKTKIAMACVVAAAVAVPAMIQQKTVSQLREQNAALQQQLAQLNTKVEDTAGLPVAPVRVGQRETQNNEHTELLQLRGEVGRLRKQFATQGASFENQRDMLANASRIRIETINAMKQLGLAARIFATDNNHKHPATFEEIENELNGMDTDRFELVKHIREVSEAEPQLILFREIEPRQLPDGSWERAYAFADGSVQNKRSPNGDFSAFEQEHMAKPLTEK